MQALCCMGRNDVPERPRILISTDIGGTDPDDNQSMTHLLMYSNEFDIEGLVSSPSYGKGAAPLRGYDKATEGSEWIVRCARKEDCRPLYVLVWHGLQGAMTTREWREEIMEDWGRRWQWLKEE